MSAADWPEPYLQPDRTKDCGYYAAAYVARCLGYPETTAEQVRQWRAETTRHEAYHAHFALGAEMRTHWTEFRDGPGRAIFWQGPDAGDWARRWLADGWIAQMAVHRIAEMGHAVVALEASDEGVLLMDPIYGHVVEPWDWFLGPGPRAGRQDWPGSTADGRAFHGCHYVEGWYRAAAS
jgi:hypothetical protein